MPATDLTALAQLGREWWDDEAEQEAELKRVTTQKLKIAEWGAGGSFFDVSFEDRWDPEHPLARQECYEAVKHMHKAHVELYESYKVGGLLGAPAKFMKKWGKKLAEKPWFHLPISHLHKWVRYPHGLVMPFPWLGPGDQERAEWKHALVHNVCVHTKDPYVTLTSKQADRAMEEYIRLTEKYGGSQSSKPRMGKKQLPAFKGEGYEPDLDGEDFDYP